MKYVSQHDDAFHSIRMKFLRRLFIDDVNRIFFTEIAAAWPRIRAAFARYISRNTTRIYVAFIIDALQMQFLTSPAFRSDDISHRQ